MSEHNPEPTHQDPAEPNEIGTEVETEGQPDPDPSDVTTDGELNHTEVAAPIEVSPAEPTAEGTTSDDKVHNVHGQDYTVTPDRGYRKS